MSVICRRAIKRPLSHPRLVSNVTNIRFPAFRRKPLANDSNPRLEPRCSATVLGDDGKPTGIFVKGYDVTDRVKAETALHESEGLFRTLAENIPSGA